MKADRLNTLIAILAVFCGLLALSSSHVIMGGILIIMAFGMLWNRGSGGINERVIYENEVKADLEIEELFNRLKDMDTPFGKSWLAAHKGYPGMSIVFGPGSFKDCIVISRKSGKVNIKHITRLENIIRDEADEFRFDNIVDTTNTTVNPRNYSLFARDKLISVMLVRHLRELIERMAEDDATAAPQDMEKVTFYYHNSSDGWLKDEEEREILRVENLYNPFTVKLFNVDGEEMASVAARKFDRRGRVSKDAGFDIYANGERFGEMLPIKKRGSEGFVASTDEGEFILRLFPACRRANIACNYRVEKDGELKAVIGGSPRLVFNDTETRQNDLILSYDDDYLVLYAILEIFIMTFNSSFLK